MATESDSSLYSEEWNQWMFHFCVGCVVYFVLFFQIFFKMMQKSLQHKHFKNVESQALSYSTNVISTINAIIIVIAISTIFHYQLWKDDNPVILERNKIPWTVFYVWSYIASYMITDTICHVIVIFVYYQQIGSLKLDIIGHHLFSIAMFILPQYPKPVYFWLWYNIGFFYEVPTIFLNLKWFAKYYHQSIKVTNIIKILFAATFFIFRTTTVIAILILLIFHWKFVTEAMDETQAMIVGILCALNTSLNSYWSFKIGCIVYAVLVSGNNKKYNKTK